jgi:hypothetical protein
MRIFIIITVKKWDNIEGLTLIFFLSEVAEGGSKVVSLLVLTGIKHLNEWSIEKTKGFQAFS